jgi:hypothetical protein
MSEAKKEMRENWAESYDNNFQPMLPMEAMDRFIALVLQGGLEAVNDDPKRLPLVTAMANLKEPDIIARDNKMEPGHKIERLSDLFKA